MFEMDLASLHRQLEERSRELEHALARQAATSDVLRVISASLADEHVPDLIKGADEFPVVKEIATMWAVRWLPLPAKAVA